jgi:AraC-like DNA-binding protein
MFKHNLAYSGLRRTFFAFFVTIFLGVNTGSFLLYTYFSATLLSAVSDSSLRMLAKIKNGTELMYEQVVSLMVQQASWDITITKVMFETERDRLEEYRASQIMQKAVVTYPYIEYMAIYNERLDTIMATEDLTADTRETLKALADRYFRRAPRNLSIPIAVNIFSSSPDPRTQNTITLIIYSPLSLENDKGVLLLGISCDYFRNIIHQMDEGDLETVLILHGNGQVITHPDAREQLADYGEMEYAAQIRDRETQSGGGYFLQKLENEEIFISYIKSSELDWTFISMIPYKKMMAPLRSLRTRVLLITFCILCAGVLASYLLAVRFYGPMRRLLWRLNYKPRSSGRAANPKTESAYIEQQLDYLSSIAGKSESLVRSKAVFNLLKNQYADKDVTNAKIIDAAFREPFYLVCLIAIDGQEDFEKLTLKEQGEIRNRIITIATDMLNTCANAVDHVIPYQTGIAFVLHLEGGHYPELDTILKEACAAIRNYCLLSVSAAAGPMVNSIFAINDSFEETEKLLRERFFAGPGKVISAESIPFRHEVPYPQAIGDKLCKEILAATPDISQGIDESLGALTAVLEQTTYEYARLHINMLIMQLLSACLARRLPVDANTFHSLMGELQKLETLDTVCAALAGFCRALIPNSRQDGSALYIINDSLALVAEHYGDSLFSVNTVADHFNITPAYFNRIFKKQKGCSFSEYLNEYRMEIACGLLRDTNQAVSTIASAVGIANANYFFTLFRKIYNQTPLQFRARV